MARSMSKPNIVPLIILILLTIGTLCGSIYATSRYIKTDSYTAVDAVVVDHKRSNGRYEDLEHVYDYRDILEYVVDGQTYTIISDYLVTSEHPPRNIGSTRTVYYNPDDPNDYIIGRSGALLMIILVVLCAASLLVTVFESSRLIRYLKERRRKRSEDMTVGSDSEYNQEG